MSEVMMDKGHPNNLQYPIDLEDSSNVGDILGQPPKQSFDFVEKCGKQPYTTSGLANAQTCILLSPS